MVAWGLGFVYIFLYCVLCFVFCVLHFVFWGRGVRTLVVAGARPDRVHVPPEFFGGMVLGVVCLGYGAWFCFEALE